MRNKRLKSHSYEAWHPRSTSTSGAGSGASHPLRDTEMEIPESWEHSTCGYDRLPLMNY